MRNLPHGFDIYLENVKTMRKIAQFFVAFLEKLNFNGDERTLLISYLFSMNAARATKLVCILTGFKIPISNKMVQVKDKN